MITNHSPDTFYIVTSAGRREEDLAYVIEHLKEWNANRRPKGGVQHEVLEEWGLVVFQGQKQLSTPKDLSMIQRRPPRHFRPLLRMLQPPSTNTPISALGVLPDSAFGASN